MPMFPLETLIAYLGAVLIVVIAPGPDNLLAISRGLGQGRRAAIASSCGAGLGILLHTLAAALGVTLVLMASPVAFWVVKVIGAGYLVALGVKALRSRDLIAFDRDVRPLSMRRVFTTGFLSNVLNPKPGLFVLAFIPQFVDASRGPVSTQMLVYGAVFAVTTAILFSIAGCFAANLSAWLARHPRATGWLNVGAGATFIASGLSILVLDRRR